MADNADPAQAQAPGRRLAQAGMQADPPGAAGMQATAQAQAEQDLYLTVTVNQARIPGWVHLRQKGPDLWFRQEDTAQLGLDPKGLQRDGGWIRLTSSPDLQVDYDALAQTLALTAEASRLQRHQVIDATAPAAPLTRQNLARPLRGVTLSYDTYTLRTRDGNDFSATTQLRSYGLGSGVLSSSFNSHYTSTDQAWNTGTRRLETRWRYDDPGKLRTLVIGDGVTGALAWNPSVRFGGITLAHDLALQPGLATTAQASYLGSATLPSTVDLYINGVKTSTQQVQPGQFQLNTTPTITGTGGAQVVITDINGVQRRVDLDLYGAPSLLAKGLDSWAVNLGWMRRDYGLKSFSYAADPLAVATWRRGVSNRLTLEAHAEQTKDLGNAGVGAYWLVAPYVGVVNASMSVSRYQGHIGRQTTVGYQWNSANFSLSASRSQRSRDYGDISSPDRYIAPARRSTSLWLNWYTRALGSFGLGYTAQRYDDDRADQRYASLSWSRELPYGASISLSAARVTDSASSNVFFLNLSMPLGRYRASAQASGGPDNRGVQWQLDRPADRDRGGWGWNVAQRHGQNAMSHAEANWVNPYGELMAGVNRYTDQTSYYAGARGTVAMLGGNFHAMRQLDDAFAVVDTGVPGVPVLLQNRPMGNTDARGLLLLTQLNSYQPNKIAIDPLALPADFRVAETEQSIIPAYGSGTEVKFAIYQARAVMLKVRDSSGQLLRTGLPVHVTDSAGAPPQAGTTDTVVGYDGQVYLENPPEGGTVRVGRGPENTCSFTLPALGAEDGAIANKEAICR